MKGFHEAMHLFQPHHFLMPFLAHAFGTLVGAMIVAYFVTYLKYFHLLKPFNSEEFSDYKGKTNFKETNNNPISNYLKYFKKYGANGFIQGYNNGK